MRNPDKIRALVDAPDFKTLAEVRAADKCKHYLMKLIDKNEWREWQRRDRITTAPNGQSRPGAGAGPA